MVNINSKNNKSSLVVAWMLMVQSYFYCLKEKYVQVIFSIYKSNTKTIWCRIIGTSADVKPRKYKEDYLQWKSVCLQRRLWSHITWPPFFSQSKGIHSVKPYGFYGKSMLCMRQHSKNHIKNINTTSSRIERNPYNIPKKYFLRFITETTKPSAQNI